VTALKIEEQVRSEFNKREKTSAKKETLTLGGSGPSHEFDLYEKDKLIGGVSTSPWLNKPNGAGKRSNNTGGQDRASAELLWLSLWQGQERRVHILTDKEMASRIFRKYQGAVFPNRIEIYHFDAQSVAFHLIGTL
jgi:hypothetical protein